MIVIAPFGCSWYRHTLTWACSHDLSGCKGCGVARASTRESGTFVSHVPVVHTVCWELTLTVCDVHARVVMCTVGYLRFGPAPRCTCMHSKAWLARACRQASTRHSSCMQGLALRRIFSAHAAPVLLAHAWGHKNIVIFQWV